MTNDTTPEASAQADPPRPGSPWRRGLSAALLLASVSYIVWYFSANSEELKRLREFAVWAAVAILALQIIYLVPQAARYRLVLERHSRNHVPWLVWFRLFVVGRLLNTVVPQGGNVYRGVRLKARGTMNYGSYVGGFLTFTWLSITLTVLLALGITALFDPSLEIGGTPVVAILGVTLVVVAGAPYLASKLLGLLPTRVQGGVVARASNVLQEAFALPQEVGFSLRFLTLSVASFTIAVAVVFLILDGLSADVGISEAALFLALLQASSVVSLTPSNLGVQEISFAALAGGLGIGAGTGLLAGSLVRVSGVIALLVAAGVSQLAARTGRQELGSDLDAAP